MSNIIFVWSNWFEKDLVCAKKHLQNRSFCINHIYFHFNVCPEFTCTRRITDKEVLISVNNSFFSTAALIFESMQCMCTVVPKKITLNEFIVYFYFFFFFLVHIFVNCVRFTCVRIKCLWNWCLMIALCLDWINYVTYFVYILLAIQNETKRNETNCSQFMKCIVNRQLN